LPVTSVLCLGLGSPIESKRSRAQLALLLAVCDYAKIPRGKVQIYDPVFSDQDVQSLSELGLRVTTINYEARYSIEVPTLVYMPHCDRELYENLIRKNWTRDNLLNIVLLGNRLIEYSDILPERKIKIESPCLFRLSAHLAALPLPVCAHDPNAFNNTAIQYVTALPPPEDQFWELPNLRESGDPGPIP